MARHVGYAAAEHGFGNPVGFFQGDAQRLLAQDMFVGGGDVEDRLRVQVIGHADQNGVQLAADVRQHLLPVAVLGGDATQLLASILETVFGNIA
ncbi:MAG: hypothetical protein NTW86_07395 [Candidatus Sumerlaeota bacterium]|nr:hypothetical protein [Candidatus Sumerlaeota bacterium]